MFARFFLRREFSATKTKLQVRRPLHHGSLATRAPVVPLPRFAGAESGGAPGTGIHSRSERQLRELVTDLIRAKREQSRAGKMPSIKRETGPVQGKGRGGPAFRSLPFAFVRITISKKKMKEAERRQTQGNHRRAYGAARALLERARLSAFHRGSHLRELFHPKGSASGQASWDVDCTGVTRLRLSQSRDAPPTPVIMPGDMMPKPPGSSLQSRPRAPPSLP